MLAVVDIEITCQGKQTNPTTSNRHPTMQGAPFPVFPIFTASIGFFGGIHGLERIGSQVVLDYMQSLLHRLTWDELLTKQLEKIRLVFMPIVNPGGVGRPRLAA